MKRKLKMQHKNRLIFFLATIVCVLTSCSTMANINIDKSGTVEFSIENNATSDLNSIAKNLFASNDEETPLITEDVLMSFFSNCENPKISVNNLMDFKIENIKISENDLQNLLGTYITVKTVNQDNSKKDMPLKEITLKADPQLFLALAEENEDIQDIFEMLMVPIYTQEECSPEEYIEMLSSFYGKKIAEKFKESNFTIDITLPSAAKSYKITESEDAKYDLEATISTKSEKNKILITIPMYRFLCIDTETIFSIAY